jgi:cyclopropane fatty-acyl-phospholipid synthase-like methyltransferase
MSVDLAVNTVVAPERCPLCHHTEVVFFHQDKDRSYFQCKRCELVTVPASFYLDKAAEKAHYDCHHNDFADVGYQRFLSRTLTPLLARVNPNSKGLDFGCGEGAVLSQMAAQQGVEVSNYDLFYFPNHDLLQQQYDFVTMTEVLEHIANPQAIFKQLQGLLNPSGKLAIMTKRVKGIAGFIDWHYKFDPTHINFYSLSTFEWIAKQYQWQLEVIENDVVMFHLPESADSN